MQLIQLTKKKNSFSSNNDKMQFLDASNNLSEPYLTNESLGSRYNGHTLSDLRLYFYRKLL